MPIQRLRMLVNDDLAAVQQLISLKTQSEIKLINDLAQHLVQSGGKRLRPLLVLLSSKACDYQGQDHIILATMIEFFHNATLLHDDVIDESALRRGRKTANTIWGSKASILMGDYLFTQYSQLMLEVGDLKIMRMLTDIAYQIGRGEIRQLSNRHNSALSRNEYFEVIHSKTSLLFAAAAALGALISKACDETQQALYTFGLHVGNAFQLIDDALDYCSDAQTIGKNIGDDLADGKLTLPLLHALEHGTPEQQAKIKTSIEQGSLEHLPEILESIDSTGAIAYTRSIAAAEIEKALSALDILPDSPYKKGLVELAEYSIGRDH